MPASTTPMMLVHVYSETPMNGARIRPATSSRMRVQQLATNTTKYATRRGIGQKHIRRVFGPASAGSTRLEIREVPAPEDERRGGGSNSQYQEHASDPNRSERALANGVHDECRQSNVDQPYGNCRRPDRGPAAHRTLVIITVWDERYPPADSGGGSEGLRSEPWQ